MTLLLLSSVFLLTPVSGVVSGGRLTSFAMKSGLIPASEWMYVPGVPAQDTGTFTEITFQGGLNRSFRVISSGETAGLNPLIASRVTEDGYAAQILVEDISMYCVKNGNTGSYAISYKNATVDFRGTAIDDIHPAGEYFDDYILVAATENTSALGVSFPISESLAIGPAYCTDRYGGDIWLLAEALYGPVTFVSAPAIDEHNSYQRVYGTVEHSVSMLTCGWDGARYFGRLSVQGDGFIAAISLPVSGVMAGYRPADNLVLLASHCEEGWSQGEIQCEYWGITTGIEFLRSPGNAFHWGFSAGISVGSGGTTEFTSLDSPWFSQIAVNPCRD
ncbi:MAG: hypothetical protein K8S62_03640 [Candidatus Sabulitectum sp.]|nr:hypothetical protein [Candidatus Sabulitectum sp.]